MRTVRGAQWFNRPRQRLENDGETAADGADANRPAGSEPETPAGLEGRRLRMTAMTGKKNCQEDQAANDDGRALPMI